MKDVLILMAGIAALVFSWRLVAQYFGRKGHGKAVSNFAGGAVGVVCSLAVIGLLVPKVDKPAPTAVESVTAATMPAVPAPELAPVTVPAGPRLGMSTKQILDGLKVQERSLSPLRDGTRRELAKVSPYMTVEVIGDPADAARYSVMFALPSDDKTAAIETGIWVAHVMGNTFPTWRGEKDNPLVWLGQASTTLTKQAKKKPDDAAVVNMVREGKKVEYKLMPVLGLLFLSVEPA